MLVAGTTPFLRAAMEIFANLHRPPERSAGSVGGWILVSMKLDHIEPHLFG